MAVIAISLSVKHTPSGSSVSRHLWPRITNAGVSQLKAFNYFDLVESHITDLTNRHHALLLIGSPEFWFITKTFRAAKDHRGEHTPISTCRCFALEEKFYVRLLSRLMSNFHRKRHLQPHTYSYYDLPCSKRDKAFVTLSPYDQWKANRGRSEHPELDTHLHSVMLLAPALVQRFNEVAPTLDEMFQSQDDSANRSLHAVKLQSPDELRDVMFYSSKLLKEPLSLLKDCGKVPCDSTPYDLYTVLPKSKREPVYAKLAYERKLLEDRAFRAKHQKGTLIPDLESEHWKGSRLISNPHR